MVEKRRAKRSKVHKEIFVKNTLLNTPLGRVVDLSESGFMLLGDGQIKEGSLYQLLLSSKDGSGGELNISLGAECLWITETDSHTQYWAGFQFIDADEDDLKALLAFSGSV